jgi:DNA mismatch repair protein MutL
MARPPHHPIRRLPPATASRIAAGEVIERPLSALKELLENALDADARAVEVRVEGALDQTFQVADDGEGIEADELALALERHATSKIGSLEDLDRLDSLGFRGEALPSIAAVSRLELLSRPRGADAAAFLRTEGGAILERGAAARAPGTTVVVRDLFFNTPARRKFLSSPTGELRAAIRMLEAYALARPEVALRLLVDGRERFDWPAAGGARERAAALWGARHAGQLLEARGERDQVVVEALLGLPEHARATREGQVVIVNRRWIQSASIGAAIRQAYGNLLPPGRFPAATVWITVPPPRLDVNVHPTKREVRFADEGLVFKLVAGTCAVPLATLQPPFTVVRGGTPEPAEPPWADRVREKPGQTSLGFDPPAALAGGHLPGPLAAEPFSAALGEAAAGEGAVEPELWQLHRTYILAAVRGGLVILDQHAAHERILFEEALTRLRGAPALAQQLMFPVLVDLSRDQFELLLELGPSLRQLGWDLRPLGPPTVVINGAPAGLRTDRPGRLLQDLLDGVAETGSGATPEQITEHLARSFACHAAIKAGDPLSTPQMRALVDRLFATSRPHGDPHGRATFVRLDLDELHRRFGRA